LQVIWPNSFPEHEFWFPSRDCTKINSYNPQSRHISLAILPATVFL